MLNKKGVEMTERTNRQECIKEWNQKKLDNSLVSIIGSGPLSNFVISNLVGLQVGKIRIIDDKFYDNNINEFLFFDYYNKDNKISKVKHLEQMIMHMNPNISAEGIPSSIFTDSVRNSNLIVDLTNDPSSKIESMLISDKLNIPLITASTGENKGKITVYNPSEKLEKILNKKDRKDYLLLEFKDEKQGSITSGVIAGLVTEEIRKSIFRLDDYDKPLKRSVTYNLLSNNRFNEESNLEINLNKEYGLFKDKKVVMIGAGAIGNFVGLGLSLLGFGEIYIIDMDEIKEHNKNRQIIYAFDDCNGKRKVDVMSKYLKKINPDDNSVAIYGKLGTCLEKEDKIKNVKLINESELLNLDCDLIIGCVDNMTARAFINSFAVKNSIPYINGGTDSFSGGVRIYSPGKTACLDCQADFYSKAIEELENKDYQPGHCTADDHQSSVVMSNQIIGSIIIGEIRAVLYPEIYGQPIKNGISYNCFSPDRVSMYSIVCEPKKKCLCAGGIK